MNKNIIYIFIFLLLTTFLFYSFKKEIIENKNSNFRIIKNNYLPSSLNNQVIQRKYYVLCYSEQHEQPLWTSYVTYPLLIKNAIYQRKNHFKQDPLILTESSNPNYYNGSGFDKGHIIPAGDMRFNEEALEETFYTSNISPQIPGFNRGMWSELEQRVRNKIIIDNDTVQIVSGPLLSNNLIKLKNSISIPKFYYKIYFNYSKMIVILLEHKKYNKLDKPNNYVISVDSLEKLTGIDYFQNLPKPIQDKLEKEINYL